MSKYVNNLPTISFPKHEMPQYKKSLSETGIISTHRILDEYNKYKIGNYYYNFELGILKVVSITTLTDIKYSPIFKTNFLKWTLQQQSELVSFGMLGIEYIILKKASATEIENEINFYPNMALERAMKNIINGPICCFKIVFKKNVMYLFGDNHDNTYHNNEATNFDKLIRDIIKSNNNEQFNLFIESNRANMTTYKSDIYLTKVRYVFYNLMKFNNVTNNLTDFRHLIHALTNPLSAKLNIDLVKNINKDKLIAYLLKHVTKYEQMFKLLSFGYGKRSANKKLSQIYKHYDEINNKRLLNSNLFKLYSRKSNKLNTIFNKFITYLKNINEYEDNILNNLKQFHREKNKVYPAIISIVSDIWCMQRILLVSKSTIIMYMGYSHIINFLHNILHMGGTLIQTHDNCAKNVNDIIINNELEQIHDDDLLCLANRFYIDFSNLA
jgi:hypothetical protein